MTQVYLYVVSRRFARIVALDDVPVVYGRAMGGETEELFERYMPVKTAIVTKDELIEVASDVFAAQPMITAERPALHQRKGAMCPRQDDVRRHLADDARIMPIAAA